MNFTKIQEQLDSNRRAVAFDSYDITLKQLYDMVLEGMVDIAPEYQRHFVWDEARQSALIESLYLGIPIPSLFMATNRDSSWEVIDGLQRLTTILNFIGAPEELKNLQIKHKKLKLTGLDKLDSMNGLVRPEKIRHFLNSQNTAAHTLLATLGHCLCGDVSDCRTFRCIETSPV